jgi:hypothetical protein
VSGPSNTLTIEVPGPCTGPPEPPSNVLAYAVGRTVFVIWDPPTSGPAAVSYELFVADAYVGSFRTPGRALSGTVAPGRYELSLVAHNVCGPSPATSVYTVVVP